jgi:hypothetical protein
MFSNDYCPPDSWYEPDAYEDCMVETTFKEHTADLLELVLNHLYSQKELDLCKLENNLDELCYLVGVEPRHGDMNIKRI